MLRDEIGSKYSIAGAHFAPRTNPRPPATMSRTETVTLLKTIADYATTLALCAEELKDTAKEAETNAYGGYEAVDTTEVQRNGFSDLEECEGVIAELKGLLKDLDEAPDDLPALNMED